jgi:hypothetical protein
MFLRNGSGDSWNSTTQFHAVTALPISRASGTRICACRLQPANKLAGYYRKSLRDRGFKVPGFQGSRVPEFQSSRVSKFQSSKNQEPGTRNQEPRTRNQEPIPNNQEPGTRNQEPTPYATDIQSHSLAIARVIYSRFFPTFAPKFLKTH